MGKRHKFRKFPDRKDSRGSVHRVPEPVGRVPMGWSGRWSFRPLRSWGCPDGRYRLRHS